MRALVSLSFVLLAACPGDAPPARPSDAAPDTPALGQRVSGKTMDYFVANTPVQDTTIITDGIDPALTAVSAADGSYVLENVPTGSKVFLSVARTNFRATRNPPISVDEAAVQQDVYLLASADVQRQYTTDGKTPTAGRAFVAAELLRNNGQPMDGIPLTDVKLLDAADAPIPGVIGPYVFGAMGDIVPVGPTTTQVHNNSARVAFLDVPPGTHSLKVTFLDGQNQPQTITTSVTTVADGATLVRSGGMGGGGGGGGSGTSATNPRFAKDIYPRLQTGGNGGIGCASCHRIGGPGAILVMNALPADVLASLTAKNGLIDLVTPAASLLLTKPLYEAPPALQNHPNATFVDINDGDYKRLLLWISQGAQL